MEKVTLVLVCHFGLESVLKKEFKKLGVHVKDVTDGEVKVEVYPSDIPRLNYCIRTAERVMIEVSTFKATTFEELFEGVYNAPIEKYVPVDGSFPITKANQDKNSILHSSTAIQSIVKKAMVERLKKAYKTNYLSEDKARYPFRLKMYKNIANLRLDTTGDSLHKRGYRIKAGLAPIEETLASALIQLTSFDKNKVLIDPFCGSGTILIEAAMIAANMMPSVDRAFLSEPWRSAFVTSDWKKYWIDAKSEADSKIDIERKTDKNIKLFGFDIDRQMINIARENAIRAGVDKMIEFNTCPVADFADMKIVRGLDSGIIITNPPYGERLEDKKSIVPIYQDLKNSYSKLKGFELNVITSFEDATKYLGKETKNRKLYNGKIKTYFYSYL